MMEETIDVIKDMDIPDFISFDDVDEEVVEIDPNETFKLAEIESNESQNESTFDATRAYLNELSKSQLLTADEEKNLRQTNSTGRSTSPKNYDRKQFTPGCENFQALFKSRAPFTRFNRRR